MIQRAQRSTRRTDQGSFQRNGKLAGHGCSMIRIRVWYASGMICKGMICKWCIEDATATPGPSQPLFPELEEEEDEVLFREKADDDGEDEYFRLRVRG